MNYAQSETIGCATMVQNRQNVPNKPNLSTIGNLLSARQVERKTGLSRSTIWRERNDPNVKFPKPIQLTTRRIAWLESEIDEFIQQRIDRVVSA